MASNIYINLPVQDLAKATAFYEALGFIKNPQFSDEKASGLAWDEHIYLMLLTHKFTKTFVPGKAIADSHQTCEVLNALQFSSREDVDKFFAKAITAGGKELRAADDHGFMYAHDFEDLDGHIREPFWMDMTQVPKE